MSFPLIKIARITPTFLDPLFNIGTDGEIDLKLISEAYTTYREFLAEMWQSRHVDQAVRVELWLAADEFPESWLADLQVRVESAIRPAMNCVLDVENLRSTQGRMFPRLCPCLHEMF